MLSTLFFTGLLPVRLATTTTVINKRAALGRRGLASQRWESKHTCIYDACGTKSTCNGCAFTSSGASSYTLNCGSRVQGSDEWVVESDGLAVTGAPDCLEACDEWPQCGGVSVASNGSCIAVSNRTAVSLVDDVGSRAYVLVALAPATPQVVATAVSASTESSAALSGTGTPPSYFNVSSSISPLAPSATVPASTQPTSQCQSANISCPACEGEQVTDATGKNHKVFCNSQIFSENQYSIQEWLSPQGCLAECDRFSWCQGTTYYANRNCELANGPDVFPEQMPGYTGFLPVATKSYTPATAASAFPTTNSYVPVSSSTATPAVVPSTTTSLAASTTLSCDSSEARCPLCDGVSVVDWLNVTYTVSCQEVPICETIIHREHGTSQFECLEYCDADPVCFAAVWNSGDCQLCQDGLDGTIFNDQPDDPKFLVYYPQSADTANVTSSLPQTTNTSVQASTTSSTGSISILPFHGGTFITAPSQNATITISSPDSTAVTTISNDTTSIIVVTSAALSILPINGATLITAPTPSSTPSVVVITGTITGADYTGS
ncbi:hypothetical protein LTR78_006597 [Recurvomyces mirabilis]|uniref:PAN-3 domain-containing protein n=1 Tax=Recurvomyces mirabilis TaxID=574656 RepID=A0AAE0WL32_9PEZI|nr:hypothetical protein LTR78_006597 [Recurvomyces mirabilis]KAK5154693.1 hypothetical protein LTS14_006272 [Recurvomyces mirabilis]